MLTQAERHYIHAFAACHGSICGVAAIFHISEPTARHYINRVSLTLGITPRQRKDPLPHARLLLACLKEMDHWLAREKAWKMEKSKEPSDPMDDPSF